MRAFLKNTLGILTVMTGLSAYAIATPSQALAAPQTYQIDASHTAVTWHIDHFGFSRPSGKFMNIEGTVSLDNEAPQNSKVDITIPISKINTGVEKLDEHLLSADFFDAEQFPTSKFVSTHVELTGENEALVTGDFTLRGITKPVTLDVKLNKLAENMFKQQTAGFTATTTLKRSDFGMTTYLPGLGDDIQINIESEANIPSGQ